MPKRYLVLLLLAGLLLVIALTLLPFTARVFVALLLVSALVVLWLKSISTKPAAVNQPNPDNDDSAPESLALSKLFEATMNGMREGLIVVDRDLKVVASNTAAHRLFNPARGAIEAQRLTELTRNPAIYNAFLDALQGTERSGVKVETHGPERLIFDLRVVPLSATSANGKRADAQGALGVFIDITRLERLEQMRQEFLSNVSHELRTPLTAILAFIETLEAGALDDREASERFLGIIRRNALRMNELLEDILELSAIETGKVLARAERVELKPIVADVIASLQSKAAERQIVLSNEVDEAVTVFADPRRLEQILTNLVENAIKFNREHGRVNIKHEQRGSSPRLSQVDRGSSPTVREGVITPQDQPPRDRIVVEDSGEGIPAQHLERLFERFYRVDRGRSRELGGIGLGLAIVKHLVRAHDGEITVTSELGKGSTFTIELPQAV